MNEELRDSSLLLQGKCETLLEDLSVKEAQWTQKEEKLYAEVRLQWRGLLFATGGRSLGFRL